MSVKKSGEDGATGKTLKDEDILTQDMEGRRSFLRRIGALLVGAAAITGVMAVTSRKAIASDTDQGDSDSSDSDDEDPQGDTSKGDHKSDSKADRSDAKMADPKLGDYNSQNGSDGFDSDEDQHRFGDGSRADSD